MINISACVVVKNEENNIKQWLNHTAGFSFEQIVIDTGSTDKTVELAVDFGANVYHFPWIDDFAAAKNFALERAKGDWIVFLDADEYFSEESKGRLIERIEKYHFNRGVDGLVCHLLNIDMDENNRLINKSVQMRVFRNRRYLRYEGKIHEHVVNHVRRNLQTQFVDLEIMHTGYTKSIVQQKLRRNLRLLEADIAENGEKPEHYGYLVSSYFGLGEYDKTIQYAKIALQGELPLLGQEYSIYRGWIDACFLGGKDKTETLAVIEAAIEKFPDVPEFIWNKGELLYLQQDFIKAEEYMLESLRIFKRTDPKIAEVRSSVFEAQLFFIYYRLGSINVFKQNFMAAVDYFKISLQCFNCNAVVFDKLYWLVQNRNEVDQILLFSELYGEQESEQKFLLKMLKKNQAGRIYAYFAQKQHEQDLADMYIAIGRRAEAFALLENELEKEYAGLLLNEQKVHGNRELLSLVLPDRYHEVLMVIYDEKQDNISEEARVFCSIIKSQANEKTI